MKIDLKEITVRDLVDGYTDDGEGGVRGYGGKLDIRPPFQREFVYGDKQRDAVIETINNDFPLNVMYWSVRDDGTYEIIDGQQRTISIAQYVKSEFSIAGLAFHNLQDDQRNQILDYGLHVYVCDGTDSEKLDWFETINISGEELTSQELRNAVYHGTWVSDAKKRFSRPGCAAQGVASKYLSGYLNRQDYLETAIKWISKSDIEGYMSKHQHDKNAVALWNYFRSVIDWVEAIFTNHRKQMKGVEWGPLYDKYGDANLDPVEMEAETKRLMMDDDITKKSGIYAYLLDGDERHLNIKTFSDAMKSTTFERQGGICPLCKEGFAITDMEGDHIDPWSKGGRTVAENCQMLCRPCNRRKGNK